jgi:hypothetical protein
MIFLSSFLFIGLINISSSGQTIFIPEEYEIRLVAKGEDAYANSATKVPADNVIGVICGKQAIPVLF